MSKINKHKNFVTNFIKKIEKTHKPRRIRIISPKSFHYKKTGTMIQQGSYESLIKLDNGTKIKIENIYFQKEDLPFFEQIKENTKMNNDKLNKILDKLEKREEKELEKELEKKKINIKNYSINFETMFEVLINSNYINDYGTMYYPYEKEEFFNLINRNKKYLNFKYGPKEESLVGKVLRSNKIARKDKKGKNIEQIKFHLIRILENAGAYTDIPNNQNENPIDIAKKLNYTNIVQYLKKA